MIPIHSTFVHPKASEMMAATLQSTFLSEGKVVKTFEASLIKEFGFRNCVTVNSGTSALHLALVLAGVSKDDEVILPAQTFVASGLVIVQQGATPVFADIDYGTGNISTESIRNKITSKTKAIIPVHWAGYPCDLEEIAKIAKEHKLIVIEDAAHALGATYKNEAIGNISEFTCFSFQAIKHLTTGDGGAVVCRETSSVQEALTRRWFGIDRNNASPSTLGERQYNISKVGFKYHLNDLAATLGLANLQNFSERLMKRRKFAGLYREELSKIDGINLFKYQDDRESAYWLFGFHVERREEFIKSLRDKGIESSVVHQRIDRNSVFGEIRTDLPGQERFDESQIHIPVNDALDEEKVHYIISVIKNGW